MVDAHSEEKVSLRIDNPFPELLQKAMSIDLASLDQTAHAHVPYIYILIQAAAQWRAINNDSLPKTFAERKAFQKFIGDMKMKMDEENFDEAIAQAHRVAPQRIPSDILDLFDDPVLTAPGGLSLQTRPFFHLLAALKEYVTCQEEGKWTLPLSASLPDFHSDTTSYVEIQKLYKTRARKERDAYKEVLVRQLRNLVGNDASADESTLLQTVGITEGMIDEFVKNSHGLRVLRSTVYGAIDSDRQATGARFSWAFHVRAPISSPHLISSLLATSLAEKPRETAIHLAFAALDALPKNVPPTSDNLNAQVLQLLGDGATLTEEIEACTGEMSVFF